MLPFTGERFTPECDGAIYYEHMHRYRIAESICDGKRVLDIASGEGYGCDLMSKAGAKSVVGVDIDGRSVDHARARYPDCIFYKSSVTAIPLLNATVDLVTSFETIEHLTEQDQMLDEIKRVMRSNALLLISSPNKAVYSDLCGMRNPFHPRELYLNEFSDLLISRWKNVRMYGQRLVTVSAIHALDEDEYMHGLISPLPNPMYFLAVCSDDEIGHVASVFVDPNKLI